MPHQIITIPSAHSSYEVDLYPETLTVLIRQRDVNNKDRYGRAISMTNLTTNQTLGVLKSLWSPLAAT